MEKEYVCTYGECSSVGVITARSGKCFECGYALRELQPDTLCKYCKEPMYGTMRVHHHTENDIDVT